MTMIGGTYASEDMEESDWGAA